MTTEATTPSADHAEDPTAARRVARWLTEAFAPWVLVATLPLLVAAAGSTRLSRDLGWGLVLTVSCSLIPMGILVFGVRRGKVTDHHARVREQRIVPLLFGLLSVVAGLIVVNLGAPTRIRALCWAMLAGLVVTLVITFAWKISVHAAVAAGTVVILVCVYGPISNLAWLVAAAICWSRVQLSDHTVAQVLGGLVMGGVTAGIVYTALV